VSNYSLQANDYSSQGLDIKYFEDLATKYLSVDKLGQITIGLEVGMESVGNEAEFEKQLKWIADNKITSLRMKDFATQYREIYNNKNPEKVVLGDWVLTPKQRINEKLGEKIVYQNDLVFKDLYEKDGSDFLNRIYAPENLIKKKLIDVETVLKLLLIMVGILIAIKFKKINLLLIMGLGIMIWIVLRARYSVIDGQKIAGLLIDNFRFVGINLSSGLMNMDLSNVVAKSMIKLKLDWLYFTNWIIFGIIGGKIYGRIVGKRTKNKTGQR